MSIHLSKASLENLEVCECHLMPATIEHDGEANVAQFFTTGIENKEEDSEMTATFRGRKLQGQVVEIPTDYKGLVLKEPNKPFTEDEDRTFKATHQFERFTYWNLEMATSANDAIVKAMVWPQIAQAIHAPIDDESQSRKSQLEKLTISDILT